MPRATSRLSRVIVSGPLAPFVRVYGLELRRRGYTPLSVVNESRQVARFSGWLQGRELGAERLTRELVEEFAAAPNDPLFATSTGRRLNRDAVEHRLAHHVALAQPTCPSLATKRITMHTLRHTAASICILAGNDITVIALWLGHEQLATTNIYLHADMSHKQEAIERVTPLPAKPDRYRPPDSLIAFLQAL